MSDAKIYQLWEHAAQTYETVIPYFDVMGQRMVECASLLPGERVLDVACGKGASLIPAAIAVGAAGRVVGVDIVPAMVSAAQAAVAGLDQVEVHVMNGSQMSFPDGSFDAVLCGAGLAFIGMREGLLEMARVLKSGGRLLASAPTGGGSDWDFFGDLCDRFGLEPLPLSMPSEAEMDMMFDQAGFGDRDVFAEAMHVDFPDAQTWWRWAGSHGQRWYLDQLDSATAQEFQRLAFERLEAFRTDDGIPLDQTFIVVRAIAGTRR